jgi:hypothetical protein
MRKVSQLKVRSQQLAVSLDLREVCLQKVCGTEMSIPKEGAVGEQQQMTQLMRNDCWMPSRWEAEALEPG